MACELPGIRPINPMFECARYGAMFTVAETEVIWIGTA